MTRENPIWMQALDYSARLDRRLIQSIFTEGVLSGLLVTQRGAGANMSVDVSLGVGIIYGDDQSDQGAYEIVSTATENVSIGAAPGSNSRIDVVYARVNDPNASGPAGDNWTLGVVAGVAAASPTVPATPTSAIALARVLVAAGNVSVVNSMITDVRAGARVVGSPEFGVAEPFFGAEADIPSDRKLCNGQAISRTTFFGCFRKLGTVYGAGDGSTTFNLPDLRGRSPFGLDNMGGSDAGRLAAANTLGLAGGAETHALTTAELATHSHSTPNHSHVLGDHTHGINHDHAAFTSDNNLTGHTHTVAGNTGNESAHTHRLASGFGAIHQLLSLGPSGTYIEGEVTADGNDIAWGTATDTGAGTAHNHSFSGTTSGESADHNHGINVPAFIGSSGNNSAASTDSSGGGTSGNAGSGTAHNNMPPYMLVNWIIRVS